MGSRYRLDRPAKLLDRRGNPLRDAEGNAFVLESLTLDSLPVDDVEPSPSSLGTTGAAVVEGPQTSLGLAPDVGGRARDFDAPLEVWKHYVAVMKPRSTGLDVQARAVIRDALKVATISECKHAIDGCKASSFHMGENDRRKKYNALSQILKGKRGGKTTREQIDMFLELAEKSGLQSGVMSGDPGRINSAKRDVLDAFEFPGDEHVQRRGDEARQWLQEQGWKIESDPLSGRPTFHLPTP